MLTVLSLSAHANDGDTYRNHIKRQFIVNAGNTREWGLVKLPSDFNTTNNKYPILFFCHGVGEVGSTEADVDKLLLQGPGFFVANQNHPMEFVNPGDGKTYKFIVVSIQDPFWSLRAEHIKYVILNDSLLKDRIDRNAIFVTGLSAGGQETIRAMLLDSSYAQLVAAIVPMSPAGGIPGNYNLVPIYGNKAWTFSGVHDGTYTGNATRFTNSMNSASPGSARLTIYNGGHGGWNAFYDPVYRETFNGKTMNMYEFLLFNKRPSDPTPVKWGRVEAYIKDFRTVLFWETLTEQNVSHYVIERSEDGVNFKEVGIVSSQAPDGNSNNLLTYKYVVPNNVSFNGFVLFPWLQERRF